MNTNDKLLKKIKLPVNIGPFQLISYRCGWMESIFIGIKKRNYEKLSDLKIKTCQMKSFCSIGCMGYNKEN